MLDKRRSTVLEHLRALLSLYACVSVFVRHACMIAVSVFVIPLQSYGWAHAFVCHNSQIQCDMPSVKSYSNLDNPLDSAMWSMRRNYCNRKINLNNVKMHRNWFWKCKQEKTEELTFVCGKSAIYTIAYNSNNHQCRVTQAIHTQHLHFFVCLSSFHSSESLVTL